jgi:imidazole glycerol-phosphate synthase subunit HisH
VIAIIDYRAGNLTSVKKAFDRVSRNAVVTADPQVVTKADKIVLPGVGHFSSTFTLSETGLRKSIKESLARKVPYLGICVGMQWMLESSEEAPDVCGLGLWPGLCERFPLEVKSPHVGWNQLAIYNGASRLLQNVPADSYVYFTHSFRVPVIDSTVAETEYGGRFSAVVEQNNWFGVQFHPEKSGAVGLTILENFCSL